MRKFLNLFLLVVIFFCCEKKQDPVKNPNLIEVLTMDPSGVVFKIIDDVDSAYNALVGFVHCVDSIYIKRFNSDTCIWFDKNGEYLCWRYPYINSKLVEIGLINKFPKRNPQKICTYYIEVFFNNPIKDTVYLKLSTIFPLKSL